MPEDEIEIQAKEWVKNNKKILIEKFASLINFPAVKNPFTIFMAGCPGAGKTEFSKSFIQGYDPNTKIVRIDADEIRDLIPQYKDGNAYKVQGAAAIGVEKIFDYVQNHNQNVILDGTFSDYDIALDDVNKALGRNRKVGIMFIYQEPEIAWEFTKKREKVEGRHVDKKMFINSFFNSQDTVNRIKKKFGNNIELNLVIKNYENGFEKTRFKIDLLDSYISMKYTLEDLERLLT